MMHQKHSSLVFRFKYSVFISTSFAYPNLFFLLKIHAPQGYYLPFHFIKNQNKLLNHSNVPHSMSFSHSGSKQTINLSKCSFRSFYTCFLNSNHPIWTDGWTYTYKHTPYFLMFNYQ